MVRLSQTALATSGDYRQFYEIDGKRYSHIIDPKTGYPVQNGVVSASAVAGNCALADGLATALMVMGPEKGLALINSLENVDALIVVRDVEDGLIDYLSRGFNNQGKVDTGGTSMKKAYYCDKCKKMIKPGDTYLVLDVKFYKQEETPEAQSILRKSEHLF